MFNFPIFTKLVDVVSSFPGLYNVSEREYNDKYILFFNVKNSDIGLFLITRCTDRRYWIYGDEWNIILSSGDQLINGEKLPITYMLVTKNTGEKLKTQIDDLIVNINQHFDKAFVNYYKIDMEIIETNYITNLRQNKITKIKNKIKKHV